MSIWTDEYLELLEQDAEQDINQSVACLYHRFCISTTAGVSVTTLPNKVRSIERITWRGKKVWPMNWEDLQSMTPHTIFVGPGSPSNIETSQSRPMWYALHPTNIHDIRFYPTPNESFDGTGDPYSPDTGPTCIISCFRNIDTSDPTASLPSYVDRRTRKAYILWKAFEKEGAGQNLKASQYYMKRYQFLVDRFVKINEGVFISKRYSLDNGALEIDDYKYPKPTLPPNFERTIY